MDGVTIRAGEGRRLLVSNVTRDRYGGWRYLATLDVGAAHGGVEVYEHGRPGLAGFFAELAADWRGFDGERTFRSLEHELTVTVRHDGKGSIVGVAAIRHHWPEAWSLSADVQLDAGSHLDTIAAELARAFDEVEGIDG